MVANRLFWCSIFVAFFAVFIALSFSGGCGGQNTEGCQDNIDCEETEYCQKIPGDCGGAGECAPIPEPFCPEVWDPVCGCDGVTYGNECEATAAGVNVALEGECPPPSCSEDSDCSETEFCWKDTGDCGGEGECKSTGGGCYTLWDPVCGCDGITYGNNCEALVVGVNIAFEGECPLPSCTGNSDCSENEYCQKSPADCDSVGTCSSKPVACPDVWDPVCGCDGETYGNACYAAAAGISVTSAGECPPPP